MVANEVLFDWIEDSILLYIRNYGTATKNKLVRFVWQVSNNNNRLNHVPTMEVSNALLTLKLKGKIKIDNSSGIIEYVDDYNDSEDIQVNTNLAKWNLRVMGDFNTRTKNPLPLSQIRDEFNLLDNFDARIEDEITLLCNWSKDGISSYLTLDEGYGFRIRIYFQGDFYPELLKDDLLFQSAKDDLLKSILGVGFFEMYSTCKTIISDLFGFVFAVITSYELLETGRR